MNDDVRKLLKLVDNLPAESDADLSAFERAQRVSRALSDAPEDQTAADDSGKVEGPQPTDDLLRFRDQVIEESLIRFVTGNYFDICPLDRTADAIDVRLNRPSRSYGDKTPVQAAIEPALRALHCQHYDKMSAAVRAGLPGALLAYFGLDDASGEEMLGPEAWARVASAYKALAAPSAELVDEAAPGLSVELTREHVTQRPGVVRRMVAWLFGGTA